MQISSAQSSMSMDASFLARFSAQVTPFVNEQMAGLLVAVMTDFNRLLRTGDAAKESWGGPQQNLNMLVSLSAIEGQSSSGEKREKGPLAELKRTIAQMVDTLSEGFQDLEHGLTGNAVLKVAHLRSLANAAIVKAEELGRLHPPVNLHGNNGGALLDLNEVNFGVKVKLS